MPSPTLGDRPTAAMDTQPPHTTVSDLCARLDAVMYKQCLNGAPYKRRDVNDTHDGAGAGAGAGAERRGRQCTGMDTDTGTDTDTDMDMSPMWGLDVGVPPRKGKQGVYWCGSSTPPLAKAGSLPADAADTGAAVFLHEPPPTLLCTADEISRHVARLVAVRPVATRRCVPAQ
jgi:hypothetical protein